MIESHTPATHLNQGEEVLTRVEILDSQGLQWCDVLNRAGEVMLGFVRCEGLKRQEPKQPQNWHAIPDPEEILTPAAELRKSSTVPKSNKSRGSSTGDSARHRRLDRIPQ